MKKGPTPLFASPPQPSAGTTTTTTTTAGGDAAPVTSTTVEHGSGDAVSGAANGVLLWVALSVLHGLAHRLLACRDFEAVTGCLKKGLGRLQSFSWLKRHAPLALPDLVQSVRRRCIEADEAASTGASAAAGGAAGGSEKDLLDHHPEELAAGGQDGSRKANYDGRDWFVACPSERLFLVGLASAKTAAAELRMLDRDASGSALYRPHGGGGGGGDRAGAGEGLRACGEREALLHRT